jgi:hypothetical protein
MRRVSQTALQNTETSVLTPSSNMATIWWESSEIGKFAQKQIARTLVRFPNR